ncbi:hypothetical protein ALNOE001_06560 [Candidatus Methanobinarius endosymbioticus]|uniref:Uncharacterized protein n=1 Tax=Candidatus Methanobinarius endosymbioticus TaxID=2006182 RepID=A0A366ME51_9EURY|nr:hypothetical protein ALNOE001_06560 [Candidatus Methanobinarius endosymbioticus]
MLIFKNNPTIIIPLLIPVLLLFLVLQAVNAGYVSHTAYPSSINKLVYKEYRVFFLDYCPLCKENDSLVWNIKKTFEGEWTCKYCDADYCAVTGYDKTKHPRGQLIKKDKKYDKKTKKGKKKVKIAKKKDKKKDKKDKEKIRN